MTNHPRGTKDQWLAARLIWACYPQHPTQIVANDSSGHPAETKIERVGPQNGFGKYWFPVDREVKLFMREKRSGLPF
jgi:hypothetical protein